MTEVARAQPNGGRIMLWTRLLSAGIGFITTIVIARMLTPAAFGIAAMAYVLTGALAAFRDVGLSQALLRKSTVSNAERDAAFWLGAGASVLLTAAIVILSPLVAAYYGQTQVVAIACGFTPAFLIGGIGLQHAALLRRDMRFRAISGISAASAIAGLVAGVGVAWLRRDTWALVAAATAQSVVATVLTTAVTRWVPSRPRNFEGRADLLRYGRDNLAFAFMNALSANLPAIVAGPVIGVAGLGHLNRAMTLFMLPVNNLVQPVVQGAMPSIVARREEAADQRRTYLAFVERLACVLMPLALIQAALAPHLVAVLLGDQWRVAGSVLAALSPALAAYAISQPASDLLAMSDRSRDLRRQGLADLLLRGGGIAVGMMFGIVGIAAGYAIGTLLAAPVRMAILSRSGAVTFKDQVGTLAAGMQTLIGAMIGLIIGKYICTETSVTDAWSIVILLSCGTIAAFVWGLRTAHSRRVIESVLSNVPGMPNPDRDAFSG